MDSPTLPAREVELALRGLARLNRLSGAAGLLWSEVSPLVRGGARTLLDIATGSADVPLAIHGMATAQGHTLEMTVSDVRPEMRDLAARNAEAAGVPLRVIALDAVRESPPGLFDIITASLFTHHLTEDEVVGLLDRLSRAARCGLVVSDLARSRANLAMVSLASRVVTRSRVVHTDAALSVRAAFTTEEFMGLARRAGLHERGEMTIRSARPGRFIFVWRPREK